MFARDEVRSLGVGQQLLEAAGECRGVKNLVLAPPDDQGGKLGGR
jgi:hypothetical protein